MATIRKRTLPSGLVRWQVDFTDQAGKRRSRMFPRRKDADVYLVKVRSLVANNTYLADSESTTVAEAAKAWLDHCALRCQTGRRMERSTLRGYSDYVRLHITAPGIGIGDKLIAQLSRRHVNEFRDRLLLNGRSEHLTRRALSVLKLVLDHAIDNGKLFTNAAQGVRVIRSGRIEHKAPVPSKEAIRALIGAADEGLKPHLIVSALGGLRASELRGLRWRDVDFDNGFLHIRQRADAYNQIGDPKSRAGFRDIPAGPMVLNALRSWKLRCPKSELGLVFPAPRGGILQHTNIQKLFRKLCRDVEVTMRWHDLRHFAVSLWIEQGFSIKEVMTFAGHSSIQMTMERYGHLFPSPDHQNAMAMVEAKLLG
ncbi:site-specific integrase [Paracoccus sp. SCSIO 75233]|uniref:tyrosine-type recombinase/integrase n=1 Tax=Paracoccus sp. SCSIO 75233 TaxID=3017782 RepID=UPI0022F06009|nr:site-specific integrase [Paracoccus sp. SCSIO 75233]WBU52998.1 site-specific integrase [Paracoccus sp. SCSIO 75233]